MVLIQPYHAVQCHDIVDHVGYDRRDEISLKQKQSSEVQARQAGQQSIGRREEVGQSERRTRNRQRRPLRQQPSEPGLHHAAEENLLGQSSHSREQDQRGGRAPSE